ncbi:MAG TPA: hypothetical protein VK166_19585 [Chitinophagaceae bacterium]|nr:hypothetical protein [Chitinophagaceae bacterium]
MRKLLSIALLALVFFSQLGYQFIYSVKLIMIRKEQKWKMLSAIDEKDLEKIEFNPSIKWKEEGREFYYQGQLYDIVKKKQTSGKTIYYVINDHKEEELMANLARTAKKQSQGQSDKKIAVQIFQQVCILNEGITDPALYLEISDSPFPFCQDMQGEKHCKILVPPPQA